MQRRRPAHLRNRRGGRGFDARISTEFDVTLRHSACVYCGNCIGVCPTGAIQFKTEYDLRQADDWRPEDQDVTRTVCSYCGVGCNLELHTQDDKIVKVTSPADHSVTSGMLCIKGRFSWQYVQPVNTPTEKPEPGPDDGPGSVLQLGRADTTGLVHHVQQAVVEDLVRVPRRRHRVHRARSRRVDRRRRNRPG